MSGPDRSNRLMRTGRAAAVTAPAPAPEAREILIARHLAVEALGAERVLFAERLRAKGWSVRGIARNLAREEATIAALFGVPLPKGGPAA